jgi:hypothetical protein
MRWINIEVRKAIKTGKIKKGLDYHRWGFKIGRTHERSEESGCMSADSVELEFSSRPIRRQIQKGRYIRPSIRSQKRL